MGKFIAPEDLSPFAEIEATKVTQMIEDAEAMAVLAAPCLADLEQNDPKRAAVKAILRRAILRWNDAGTGVRQQFMAGPFSQMNMSGTNASRNLFWPSEVEQLQGLCRSGSNKAFVVDTVPADTTSPLSWIYEDGP